MSRVYRMKRIIYVSTLNTEAGDAKFSSSLMKILNAARDYNNRNGLSGVLLTSGSTVLQVLEGESAALGPLMYRIGRDSRHKDVSIVSNEVIDTKMFANWSMRLLAKGSLMHGDVVQRIKSEAGDKLSPASEKDRARLADIFQTNVPVKKPLPTAPSVSSEGQYNEQLLSMSAWPRPNQIRITGEIVDLCSNLVGKQRDYSELRTVTRCKSEEQLLGCLTAVDKLGLLKKQSTLRAGVSGSAAVAKPSSDRFSRVLRKFISSARS